MGIKLWLKNCLALISLTSANLWVRMLVFCPMIFIFSFVGFVYFNLGGGLFVFFVAGWKSFFLLKKETDWLIKLSASLPVLFSAFLAVIIGFLANRSDTFSVLNIIYYWFLFVIFYSGWLLALAFNAIKIKVNKQAV